MITAHLWSKCIMSAVCWNISRNILSFIATNLLSHFLPFISTIESHLPPIGLRIIHEFRVSLFYALRRQASESIKCLFLVCRSFDPDCKNKDTTQRSDTLVWQTALERYFNKRDFLVFTVGVPPIFWGQPQLP